LVAAGPALPGSVVPVIRSMDRRASLDIASISHINYPHWQERYRAGQAAIPASIAA
jgi:hypothetical protein